MDGRLQVQDYEEILSWLLTEPSLAPIAPCADSKRLQAVVLTSSAAEPEVLAKQDRRGDERHLHSELSVEAKLQDV